MEDSAPQSAADSRDRLARLVPSGVTFLFVMGLIVAARFYDLFPVKPAPCGMRTLTGIPCLGCGGTRAMTALAQGDVLTALSFNPLAIVAVLGISLWFAMNVWRTFSGTEPRSGRKIPTRWIVTACILIGVANWIYLILFLPE